MGVTKTKKKTYATTQSISPVLDIRDGIVVTRYMEFLKVLEFAPINFEMKAPSDQIAEIERFGAMLKTLPSRIHIKVISTPSDVTPFIKDLEKAKEREEKDGNKACVELIVDQINLISDVSRTQGVSRRFFIILQYTKKGGLGTKRPPFEEIKASLERDEREIIGAMSEIGNKVLSSNDRDYILKAFYAMYCKVQSQIIPYEERKESIIERYQNTQDEPIDETLIPINDFIMPDRIDSTLSPQYIVIDGAYITYAYIPREGYPNRVPGGWLAMVFAYMDCVDLDFYIEKGDPLKIQRKLSFQLKNNVIRQNGKDVTAQDYESVQSALEAGMYIKQAIAEGDEFCYMGTLISIYGNTAEETETRFQELKNYLLKQDFRLRKATFEQENAFISTLPSTSCDSNLWQKMKRNVMSSQLAGAYPFTAYEMAEKGGVFIGVNDTFGSPVFINSYDRSVTSSGNFIICGPSGSGKTYTLLNLLMRLREHGGSDGNLQVMVISPLKGNEMYEPCRALGGQIVRISPGYNNYINVLDINLFDQGESAIIDNYYDKGSLLDRKISSLRPFFDLICKGRSESEERILGEALKAVYTKNGIIKDNKSLWDENNKPKEMPTLEDLTKELEKYGSQGQRMRDALSPYVTGEFITFARKTNVDLTNKFIVFDITDVNDDMLAVSMFVTMDYIMAKAKATLTTSKIIAVDECWRLLKASPLAGRYLRDCAKEIRGAHGNLICASQDIHDWLSSEYGEDIVNNARYKIFMQMDKKEIAEVTNLVDLTDWEKKKLLSTNIKGQDPRHTALLVVNDEHLFIKVTASSIEHDLITTNAKDRSRIAKKKAAEKTA